MPAITRVVLFGSLVHGTPSPRSDADLIVIVRTSPHAHGRDRIPDMLAALAPLPCPIDLFVLTEAEVESGLAARSPLLREALGHGLDLLESRM
jgi:predicted nucleotidyltransferase